MYAPHTVTIYNIQTTETPENDFSAQETLHISVLRGAFLDVSKAVNTQDSGLVNADVANLYIPFSVESVDGLTSKKKSFVKPQKFSSTEQKDGLWTLSDDGTTYFVDGERVVNSSSELFALDECYKVTRVDAKDHGSMDMRHWEVGGA